MTTTMIFIGALLILGITAVLSLLTSGQRKVAGALNLVGVGLANTAMLYLTGMALLDGSITFDFGTLHIAGVTAALIFRIDALSALFVGMISILAIASALYGIGYINFYSRENTTRYYLPFPLFIMGMLAVVTTADWLWFLVFWEFMTMTSYFLVIYENREKENLSAGFIYFFMTHLTSLGIVVAIMILSNWTGTFSFNAMPNVLRNLTEQDPVMLNVILCLFFLGFATKAGMYPLGIWLPAAHPAAPASVSALLSGVMIKLGVYGLLRVFVWTLPFSNVTVTWGVIIAACGVLSMLVGTLRALGEHDCKRLLAQHSIGQMGYILLGLGLGLAFIDVSPVFSMVAFIACLYHIVNHACFKSLLFFNTGSLLFRTGTRNLDFMGGLVKIMPVTAACAVVGALSIAGIPPFNGFVSKWLLYQAAIFGNLNTPLYVIFGIIAIFISTVTLASFIKYLGTAYLGTLPDRYKKNDDTHIPATMTVVEAFLAVVCFIMGACPGPVVKVLLNILQSGPLVARTAMTADVFASLPGGGVGIMINGTAVTAVGPLIILAILTGGVLIGYSIYQSVDVATQSSVVWNCGEILSNESFRYRASSFYQPFKKFLSFLCQPQPWPKISMPKKLLVGLDLDRWVFFPGARGLLYISRILSGKHSGLPQFYLLWQVIGIVICIGLLFWMMGE